MTTISMKLNDDIDIIFEVGYFIDADEEGNEKEVREGYVYLKNHFGEVIQDIAVIRPDAKEENTEVLVYSDVEDEDYTDKFVIPTYKLEDSNNED